MFIYLIINKSNFKKYIGMTTQEPKARYKQHIDDSKYRPKYPIHMALNKYGIKNFIFEVIDSTATTKKELIELEIYYIKELNTTNSKIGYNATAGGEGVLGQVVSEETRKKISKANKGRKKTKEERKKLSEAHKGKKLSKETKMKISQTKLYNYANGITIAGMLGKKMTQEAKEKISIANTGKKRTIENKEKISKSLIGNQRAKGIKHSEETKQKHRERSAGEKNGMYGKTHSKSVRINISLKNSKPVLQFTITGILIKEFSSLSEASKHTKISISCISKVCLRKQMIAGGFRWAYKSIFTDEQIKRYRLEALF